jgi:hypothetical protein
MTDLDPLVDGAADQDITNENRRLAAGLLVAIAAAALVMIVAGHAFGASENGCGEFSADHHATPVAQAESG